MEFARDYVGKREVFGEKLWHHAELFVLTDNPKLKETEDRGKMVMIGAIGGKYWDNFIYNYAHPIATRSKPSSALA